MKELTEANGVARIRIYFLGAFFIILVLKLFFAQVLDLYSDEIFYWQASQFPAIAYSDLPFMAALYAGLGTSLLGDSAFAVRALFLITGTAIPFLVYWIGLPLLSRRQALEAAALSLCLPLGGFLGLLAVPDVPLLFYGLLFIGCLERATRVGSLGYWVAAGFVAALGISTHYRFALYLLAGFLYLTVFPSNHRFWKTPGLWIAALILMLGLYPMVSFNLGNQLSGLDYHLLERHPWEFQAEGLLHVIKQAVLVTPLMYIGLVITLARLLINAHAGDTSRGLFALCALINLGVYLILAPWTDSTRTSIHWPLSGYLPLIVFLPETLRFCFQALSQRYNMAIARRVIYFTVILGFCGSLLALVGVGSQAFHESLSPLLGKDLLSTKMAGWKELNSYVDSLLASEHFASNDVIVTDNYYTAAQLALGLSESRPIFNIDQDKAIRDGRAVQYQIWQLNEAALKTRPDIAGLFITEDSTLTAPDKRLIMERACAVFGNLHYLSELSLFNGAKVFRFYRGDGRLEHDTQLLPCPLPTLGWVDHPSANADVAGTLQVSGWVINEGEGVESIAVQINGKTIGIANYGQAREDVVTAMNVKADPHAPNLGFDFKIEVDDLPKGRVELRLQALGISGETQIFGVRTIKLR